MTQDPPTLGLGKNNTPDHDTLALLSHRVSTMHQDVTDVKMALNRLTDAITKLSLIEQDQAYTKASVERAFAEMSKQETRQVKVETEMATNHHRMQTLEHLTTDIATRLRSIEAAQVNTSRTSQWVDKAVLALIVLLTMFVGTKLGIAGGKNEATAQLAPGAAKGVVDTPDAIGGAALRGRGHPAVLHGCFPSWGVCNPVLWHGGRRVCRASHGPERL